MNGLKIKICGLREQKNISSISVLHPDFMGFIFYPESPRYVGDLHVESLSDIPDSIKKVGVFVNEDVQKIRDIARKFNLDLIQLHGDETPAECADLQSEFPVIKAIGVRTQSDMKKVEPYIKCVDYFLFDTKGPHYGGHGESFDWKILDLYNHDIPFFLSGGIGLNEMEHIPDVQNLYCIDINSRFEIAPGVKDVEMISKGFELLKNGK